MKLVLTTISMAAVFALCISRGNAATNLVSNTAIVTNRVQGIVTYTMSNGVARVQDPSGKLIGTAEERALKVAAEGQVDIASAAADAAGTAMEEWREFTATTDVKVVYIDAGFTQDLPALAPNLCGLVAGSFYDREKGEDHYYVWFNREMDAPPSMCARIVSESGTNWLDGAWADWAVTNWVQNGREVEWRGAGKYSAEVEYLESHGTEYIDTGILSFWTGTKVVVDIRLKHIVSESDFFGGQDPDYAQFFNYLGSFSGRGYVAQFGTKYVFYFTTADTIRHVHKIDWPNRMAYCDGNGASISILSEITASSARGNFTLCQRRRPDGSLSHASLNEVFSCKIERDGILVRDFLPVLDIAGRPAMYDRVSGQLFYNQGTGEFSYGPVTAAPVPCRELVVTRRNANCVLKTGTVITLGGKDGFDADIHKVNIEVGGTPTPTTSAQLPLFYAVTRSGTNTVTRAYTNGFLNVENGFIKEPSNE